MTDLFKTRSGTSLLALALDAGRLEGVAVRRTNGSVEVRQRLAVPLSLDLLTSAPELAGREIRKQLDEAGIRDRTCAVCVPLSWALTVHVKVPDLPEADQESLLQVEAERSFPSGAEALLIARSRYRTPAGEQHATLLAVPRNHVARLEAVLRAAQLKPASFTLGLTAGPEGEGAAEGGAVTLLPGENGVGLLVTAGGGLVALRLLEGALELEGTEKRIQLDQVIREIRITLGQLPADLRSHIRRLRVLGRGDLADELAEQLRLPADALELRLERVRECAPREFGLQVPPATPASPAMHLALRRLSGQGPAFEFLPPRVSTWQRLTERYSSARLVWGGVAAGALAAVVALAFLVQQVLLWHWQSKWDAMKVRVTQLDELQGQVRKYRPWFDDSFRSLSILRRLTEAFPAEGTVAAKTVELREPARVSCTGTARDNQSLLRTLDLLRQTAEISEVKLEQMRGRSPLEFTFSFQWRERSGS